MNPGDKFKIKYSPDQFEVMEDTSKKLLARNLTTGEEGITIFYNLVSDWPRCAYCGKLRKADEMMSGMIIFRTRINGKAAVTKATNTYCKDKPCHSHDQMAHEG